MWTSPGYYSLLLCSSLAVLVSAGLRRQTRQDNGVDPAQVCECVSYDRCVDGRIVAEELSTRYKTCEGVVDVCCLPEQYAYLGSTTEASYVPETSSTEPYQPEEPSKPVKSEEPYRPETERPERPHRPEPVEPEEPHQPEPVHPQTSPILAPRRPHGTGCGLKRIPQGSYGQEVDLRITSDDRPPDRTGFGEYPWMVAIFRKEEGGNKFVCGGSLIRSDVVLTGAHCLRSAEIGELKVRAGDWDTQSTSEPIPYQDRSVSRLIPHADFKPDTLANNVALIVLDHPFTITDSVDTVCIPSNQGTNIDTHNCVATGWGLDKYGEEGTFQKVLRKVHLPLVKRETCQEQLRTTRLGKYFILHPSFICAGGIANQDTCYGDGGGPLVCPKKDDKNRYVQVGIVSWGIGCGKEVPGVYASVQYFATWISKHLS